MMMLAVLMLAAQAADLPARPVADPDAFLRERKLEKQSETVVAGPDGKTYTVMLTRDPSGATIELWYDQQSGVFTKQIRR